MMVEEKQFSIYAAKPYIIHSNVDRIDPECKGQRFLMLVLIAMNHGKLQLTSSSGTRRAK
jgi:hypothetical protein